MRKIYLIRHGEPDVPDKIHRCLGKTNVALNEEGKLDGEQLKSWFEDKSITAVFTSPLLRCVQTAEYIAKESVPIIEEEDLIELDAGSWENMTFAEIRRQYPVEFEERGKNLGTYAPPGGETFLQGSIRFGNCMNRIIAGSSGDIAVVAHGGVNRGWLCSLLEIPLDQVLSIPQPYGGITEIVISDGEFTVKQAGFRPDDKLIQNAAGTYKENLK